MTARLLDIAPEEYHARPGFSASLAKILIAQSPLHAWQAHPHYGAKGKVPTKLMDRGSAIHTFVLGKGARIACLPYDSWRTDASKESREKTRAAGMVPVLHEDYTEYETTARAIRTRLNEAGHFLSDATGRSEAAFEWHEETPDGALLCRCMMDWVDVDRGLIYELKIVDNAHPDAIERNAENMGHRIAAAAYIRALADYQPALFGRMEYRFLFCEAEPPYAFYDPPPEQLFLETGDRDWRIATSTWQRCVTTNYWPHYERSRGLERPHWALAKEGYRR